MKIKARISQIIPKDKVEEFMLPYHIIQLKKNIISLESLEYPQRGFIKRFIWRIKNRKREWFWAYVCDTLPNEKVGDIIEVDINPLYEFAYFYTKEPLTNFIKPINADFPYSKSLICVKEEKLK